MTLSNSISIISDTPMGAILAKTLKTLGFIVRRFPKSTDYIVIEQPDKAIFLELNLDKFLGKDSVHVFDFLETCNFRADMVLFYCAANYLRTNNLSPTLVSYPVPLCYLPAPIDFSQVSEILQNETGFVKKHDVRAAAALTEIFRHLTDLRHSIINSMVRTKGQFKRLRRNPDAVQKISIPQEADGQLCISVFAKQYREKVDVIINMLPNHLAEEVDEWHKQVLLLTSTFSARLLKLLAPNSNLVLLSSQVLETDAEFNNYTKSFKTFLEQTAKGIIGNYE